MHTRITGPAAAPAARIMATAVLAAAMLAGTAAAQDRAGEATRATPDSFQVTDIVPAFLQTGGEVYRYARVFTKADGSLDLRLDDGSQLSVGPDSDLTIDDYVYNPDAATSRATIRLGRGVLRMISGQMPSNRVSIRTPVATIGIRGTEFVLDTRETGAVRVWVTTGTVVALPDASTEVFVFDAPAFAICTAGGCSQGDAPALPALVAPPGAGTPAAGAAGGQDGPESSGNDNDD